MAEGTHRQIEARLDDGTPSVLRENEMWIDQQKLAAVQDQGLDVRDEFFRLA